ncbi:MAG TPA: hypothetical protein VF070_24370 [Streptosporangiaceae bacterium]
MESIPATDDPKIIAATTTPPALRGAVAEQFMLAGAAMIEYSSPTRSRPPITPAKPQARR